MVDVCVIQKLPAMENHVLIKILGECAQARQLSYWVLGGC